MGVEETQNRYAKKAEKQLGKEEEKLLKATGCSSMEQLDLKITELTTDISELKQQLATDDTATGEDKLIPERRGEVTTRLGEKLKERDKLAAAKREYIAATKEVGKEATEKAKELEENNDLIRIRTEIAQVDADIAKTPDGPAKDALLTKRSDLTKEAEKIQEKDGKTVRRAKHAEKLRQFSAEHDKEAKDAEANLAKALAEGLEEAEKSADTDPTETADEDTDAEATAAAPKNRTNFGSRFSKVSFSLAKGLADNPPDPDSTVDKVIFHGKGILLRIGMAFSSDHEWVNDLNEDQQITLEKTLGLHVQKNEAGEPVKEKGKTVLKWMAPEKDYRAPDPQIKDIFKDAFGDKWDDVLSKIGDASTLADLVKVNGSEKLVAALRAQNIKEDAKVLEFIVQNGDKIKEQLAKSNTPATGAPAEPATPTEAATSTGEATASSAEVPEDSIK